MPREPIRVRRVFQPLPMRGVVLWEISRRFHRLCPGRGQVAHVLRTLPPVAARCVACVKPAASVHPEPGSNSSLYITNSLSLTPLPSIKESTLSFFVLLVLACTYLSILSMNLSLPFSKGLQRYTTFLNRQNFFAFFLPWRKIMRPEHGFTAPAAFQVCPS